MTGSLTPLWYRSVLKIVMNTWPQWLVQITCKIPLSEWTICNSHYNTWKRFISCMNSAHFELHTADVAQFSIFSNQPSNLANRSKFFKKQTSFCRPQFCLDLDYEHIVSISTQFCKFWVTYRSCSTILNFRPYWKNYISF